MSPQVKRDGRRARRKLEVQERILRAALDLFAGQGFFATTVEQITEAADVGKGTFFNYFPSKEHVLAGFGDMQLNKVETALVEARTGKPPARDVLKNLMYSLAEEPGRSQALVRSILLANLSSEAVRQLFRSKLERGRLLLERIIALGQQAGDIDRHRTATELARVFQQTFIGTLLLWAVFPPSGLKDWLAPSFEVFWSGICARRTESRGREGSREQVRNGWRRDHNFARKRKR